MTTPPQPLQALSPETTLPATLPDLLQPGLDLVFVGINPGEQSARAGHYYDHRGNVFWRSISGSGLAGRELGPADDHLLPDECAIGFTDVVKRVVTDSTAVTSDELRAAAPTFLERIAAADPRVVCFTSTRAFESLFPGVRRAEHWGRQPVTIADAEVWVMPSTSGRAAKWHDRGRAVLAELSAHLGRTA
ncbi:MAG TPA: mismatch-specific DNA-glycosylase [Dehalococcoidia bacterium]|jgi:TDG/mug DNA glycosylase family protein|nr:mismatch-specific DNA-glycosylase [Dehalococcoidia bacterium]